MSSQFSRSETQFTSIKVMIVSDSKAMSLSISGPWHLHQSASVKDIALKIEVWLNINNNISQYLNINITIYWSHKLQWQYISLQVEEICQKCCITFWLSIQGLKAKSWPCRRHPQESFCAWEHCPNDSWALSGLVPLVVPLLDHLSGLWPLPWVTFPYRLQDTEKNVNLISKMHW